MAWTRSPSRPSEVRHYSEDDTIAIFEPHVPATNPNSTALVWAIEPAYAPLYWFPRECPRIAVWANDDEQRRRLRDRFATDSVRVQYARASDETWVRGVQLYEYAFDSRSFAPWDDAEGQWVCAEAVRPVAVRTLPDLVDHQRAAGVDLRLVDDLPAARAAVLESALPFSIVRWANVG